MEKIAAPGKKWAKIKAHELAAAMNKEIQKLDRAELEALILTCKDFTGTNCGWTAYGAKEAIISLAQSHLQFITPANQQKKLSFKKLMNP